LPVARPWMCLCEPSTPFRNGEGGDTNYQVSPGNTATSYSYTACRAITINYKAVSSWQCWNFILQELYPGWCDAFYGTLLYNTVHVSSASPILRMACHSFLVLLLVTLIIGSARTVHSYICTLYARYSLHAKRITYCPYGHERCTYTRHTHTYGSGQPLMFC